jgi:hypothetical protein
MASCHSYVPRAPCTNSVRSERTPVMPLFLGGAACKGAFAEGALRGKDNKSTRRHASACAIAPIARPLLLMHHSSDDDASVRVLEQDGVGERSAQLFAADTTANDWPALGSALDLGNRSLKRLLKSQGDDGVSVEQVPLVRSTRFGDRCQMPAQHRQRYLLPKMAVRASDHGIARASPRAISAQRCSATSAHSSSTEGSSPTLATSSRASARRSSSGRCIASARMAAVLLVMCESVARERAGPTLEANF